MLKLLAEVPEKFDRENCIKIKLFSMHHTQEREVAILGFSRKYPTFFNYSEQCISFDFSISDKVDHILIEISRNSQFTEIMSDKEIEEFFTRYIYSDLDKKIENILEGFEETLLRKKKAKEDLSKNFHYKEANVLYLYIFDELVDGVYNISHKAFGIDITVTIWRSTNNSYGSVFFVVDENDAEKRLIKENIVYNYFKTRSRRGH